MVSLVVKDYMIKQVITFNKNDSIIDICQTMADRSISCVIIVEKGKPIGLVTERDIIKKIVSKNMCIDTLKAKDVMSKKVLTIAEDENIFNIVKIMEKNHIRRLPVVRGVKVVGLITQTDLVKAMSDIAIKMNEQLVRFITNN
ncbi:MAG: CBS domain-containing protein [Candidatus Woesearchaeota archaeon]